MDSFIAKFFLILVVVVLGVSAFMGDTGSVKSSISGMMTKTTTQIDKVAP